MADPSKKNVRTSALFRKLMKTTDIERFIESNADELELAEFHTYINDLCLSLNKIPEQVIKRACIERTYGHQLFNGTRNPSRDKVIQLSFGLQLNIDETQRLLQVAGKNPLYPKIKRDAAILFCLKNGKDVLETQVVLQNLDLTLLGGD